MGGRRGIALLLLMAVAFVASQSIAQQHVHIDGDQSPLCTVCHHADKSPHAVEAAHDLSYVAYSHYRSSVQHTTHIPAPVNYDRLSRAPPHYR